MSVGNIAILAKDLDDVEPPPSGDGLVDNPDENNFGGKQIYAFDEPVHIGSFLFIDKDHGTPDRAVAYDASTAQCRRSTSTRTTRAASRSCIATRAL